MALLPALSPGERARCSRCGFTLTVSREEPFARVISFSISSLVMLVIAMSFPFLTITAAGISNSMTLLQTVSYLADYGANVISVMVLLCVILIPVLMLVLMLVLATSLQHGLFTPLLRAPARWLFHLNAWAMVEVFGIGVIVSLVKLAEMAKVELGLSFWAYLAFAGLFLLAFSSMDRLTVWRAIDRAVAKGAR